MLTSTMGDLDIGHSNSEQVIVWYLDQHLFRCLGTIKGLVAGFVHYSDHHWNKRQKVSVILMVI